MVNGKQVNVCAGCKEANYAVVMDKSYYNYGKCALFPHDMTGCGRMLDN
jgi:hypothetical protein